MNVSSVFEMPTMPNFTNCTRTAGYAYLGAVRAAAGERRYPVGHVPADGGEPCGAHCQKG